mmetsp:Transcript_2429/g.5646  ORF Transcript_2429/g.5646 Transcript_2429/m.5646 type:complete len:201 (-) Transcript_2429:235-837(-)|eukprot:CAMPEP_0171125354 /NCGR_PEP_ID=MMETSP0766_2-20121228/111097_1 /TAXON_ID=439317 /ORGANISM="Gambierdiscus australes, Strain CAWD 149" /LENGTH=200 /DNA_ID=CAMNT_0011588337 /DNA_START=209 /DNA_END=811 /DNA_ORIENTATION=+
MLLSSEPLSSIRPAVRPSELPLALLPVVYVRALVAATIWPLHSTKTAHLAVAPLPRVQASVSKGVRTLTVHDVIYKLPGEAGAVSRGEDAEAMLLAASIIALELGAINPSLKTTPGLGVLAPFAFVGRAIRMQELPSAVCAIFQPLTVVHVAVRVHEPAGAMGPVLLELPIIPAAVRPDHNALAVSPLTKPLPSVRCTAL